MRKLIPGLLAGAMALSLLVGGCGGNNTKKEVDELRRTRDKEITQLDPHGAVK